MGGAAAAGNDLFGCSCPQLRGLEGALQKKRQEETLEREMRLAEIFIAKANNIQQHAGMRQKRRHGKGQKKSRN